MSEQIDPLIQEPPALEPLAPESPAPEPPVAVYEPMPAPPNAFPSPESAPITFCVYDAATGRIVRTGRSQNEERALAQGMGNPVLLNVTADDANDYVVDATVVPRPELPGFDRETILANGVDVATIALPVGAVVTHEGTDYTIDDGSFEFAADVPGTYTLVISNVWPAFDETFTIEATS